MNDSGKLYTLLDSLTELLFKTWSAFLVAKNLDPYIDNNDLAQVRYLIVSVQVSCVESTLLGFSKLMSDKKDEVSIGYLLNICIAKPCVFTCVSQADVLQTAKRHQEQIVELKSFVLQVKMWRDWVIAHLDRKYVNDPALIDEMQPVEMEIVEKSFIMLLDIINVYRRWLNMGLFQMRDGEEKMTDEWEYLVGLIQRNGPNKG